MPRQAFKTTQAQALFYSLGYDGVLRVFKENALKGKTSGGKWTIGQLVQMDCVKLDGMCR